YVAVFDPDEDPEEDPEDDHVDYPTDGGDGDDEPSDDYDDDDDTDDEDGEPFEDEEDGEEEEHLALADSSVVPIVDPVLPARDAKALEAGEPTPTPRSPHTIILFSQTRLRRERKTIRLEPSMSASMEACIARYSALLSPPLPVPSPPLPLPSPLTTSPTNIGAPLGYRAAEIKMRALLPSTSRRTDIPKADVSPRKRDCLTTLALEFEVGRVLQLMEIAPTTLEGVDQRVTELDTTVRQRIDEFEIRFEEAHDERAFLRACVNTLFRDRPDHHHTAMLLDREAMYSREAWAGSEDRSAAIAAYVRILEAHVVALIAQTSSLQTQLTTTLEHIEILEARDPEPQKGPAEAGSSSTPATTTTPTTTVIDAQLQAPIDRGVAAALAEHDADRSRNGDNSNDLGTGGRRQMTTPRECTYTDFLKCQPMSFQDTEGVIGLTRWKCLDMVELSHEQPFKRNNVARAYTSRPGDKKPYGGTKPLCSKCNYHNDGPSAQKCINCKKIAHLAYDCKGRPAATNNNNNNTNNTNNNNQRAQGANARGITCFECGVQGHYKSDCPKLKNGNQGNRARNENAVARAYAVGTAETNPNSNVFTGTFLLNNRYASILFDTGADRSFITTAFSLLIDIIPTTPDRGYDVELADDRIIWVNTLIRGCTLNFLNHPFNIDLMPVEMGSFDVIIGMDWLVKYHAIIVYNEKLVRVPFDNKILIFHGDGNNNGHESRLNIISCTKTQRYLLKGCPVFLAHVTTKGAEDKSEEKQLEDVPIVQDFLEVFPEDLPGIPPTRQMEFQIDLVPGAAPVARAPYQLAPS
nr:putative reverse transcriptase domain-containing protein [Tanacetum cinerariifolium]